MQMVTLGLPPKYRRPSTETIIYRGSMHRRSVSDSLTQLKSKSNLFNIVEQTNNEIYTKSRSIVVETNNGLDGRKACDAMEEMTIYPPSDDKNKQKSVLLPPSSSTAVFESKKINDVGPSRPTMQSTETNDGEALDDEDELDIRLKWGHNFAPNMDPKKIKRILANRLSAQKSRMKKLEYRAELERTAKALQAEINILAPQVVHYDRQRFILRMENNALKQRIARLANEKVNREAEFHALKEEIERLTQIYLIQQRRKAEEERRSAINGATRVEGIDEQQQQQEEQADENYNSDQFVNSLIG